MAKSPAPEEIKTLRKRHSITQQDLADSLYGIGRWSVVHWETGFRNCQPIVWWAMKMIWDKEDIWTEEEKGL